jgi:ABC-type transport system involved in multi-copper enzyme maturation permease subunit
MRKKRKIIKALAICTCIALIEFLLFWLIGLLTINNNNSDPFIFNILIRNQLLFLLAATFADIPIFSLVFYYVLRQKKDSKL